MIGYSYCSGIGAPEVAAPWIDWRFASDIAAFPRAVLAHRFGYGREPGRVLWGDFSALRPRHIRRLGLPWPSLIVAGTPCQAFSVAGKRGSLDDVRGNLTLELVRNVHSLANASGGAFRWLLWENVVGVLSMRDNAFGCFLGGLVGADRPFDRPAGASWPFAGMASGPKGRLAWRVFNAQHFGVPQRRRRVFVVFCPGNGADPAGVLFERAGGGGNVAASGPSREAVAGDPARRADAYGEGLIATSAEGGVGFPCLTASALAKGLHNQAPLVAYDPTQVTSATNRSNPRPGDPCHPLTASGAPPLLVAFSLRQDPDAHPYCPPLDTGNPGPGVAAPGWVRRITPVEAERLQGFPDGHTAIPWRWRTVSPEMADWLTRHCDAAISFSRSGDRWRTDAAPDSLRGAALGNSQAVPNVRWILDRIAAAEGIA
jgi:DNA (cytosine-5)-methyltransferase 1